LVPKWIAKGVGMADKRIQTEKGKPARQEFSSKGRKVVVTRQGDREILQIDGRVEGFYRTEKGYLLKKDAFQRPAKTLRDAVERFLEHEAPR
jgi:hypothetical protein